MDPKRARSPCGSGALSIRSSRHSRVPSQPELIPDPEPQLGLGLGLEPEPAGALALEADPAMPFSSPTQLSSRLPFTRCSPDCNVVTADAILGSDLLPALSSSVSLDPCRKQAPTPEAWLTADSSVEPATLHSTFPTFNLPSRRQSDRLPIGASSSSPSLPQTHTVAPGSSLPADKLSLAMPPLPDFATGPFQGPASLYPLFTQNTIPIDPLIGSGVVVGHSHLLSHPEELPPYSRYPDQPLGSGIGNVGLEAYDLQLDPTPVSPISLTRSSSPLSPPVSLFDPVSSQSIVPTVLLSPVVTPVSRRSTLSGSQSHYEINTAARTVLGQANCDADPEKYLRASAQRPASASKWQRRARKRICSIVPIWALLLAVSGLLIVVIVAVSVEAHMRYQADIWSHDREAQAIISPLGALWSDVIALDSIPSGLPGLDPGLFLLPPLVTRSGPISCLTDPSQSHAWSCAVSHGGFAVNIQENDLDQLAFANYNITLTPYFFLTTNGTAAPSTQYPVPIVHSPWHGWGAEPPELPQSVPMILVRDVYDPDQGPAWWAHLTYNKTVVIPQNQMQTSTAPTSISTSRSQASSVLSHRERRRGHDKDNDGDSGGDGDGDTDFSRNDFHLESLYDHTEDYGVYGGIPSLTYSNPGDRPWICTWPGTILEVYVYPMQNSTAQYPMIGGTIPPLSSISASAGPTPTTSTSTPSSDGVGITTGASITPEPYAIPFDPLSSDQPPPLFPNVVKVKERRVPGVDGFGSATCRQVEVVDRVGGYRYVVGPDGQPIMVLLAEKEGRSGQSVRLRRALDRMQVTVEPELSPCGCLWWVY